MRAKIARWDRSCPAPSSSRARLFWSTMISLGETTRAVFFIAGRWAQCVLSMPVSMKFPLTSARTLLFSYLLPRLSSASVIASHLCVFQIQLLPVLLFSFKFLFTSPRDNKRLWKARCGWERVSSGHLSKITRPQLRLRRGWQTRKMEKTRRLSTLHAKAVKSQQVSSM